MVKFIKVSALFWKDIWVPKTIKGEPTVDVVVDLGSKINIISLIYWE
jgi:hypothetical protein